MSETSNACANSRLLATDVQCDISKLMFRLGTIKQHFEDAARLFTEHISWEEKQSVLEHLSTAHQELGTCSQAILDLNARVKASPLVGVSYAYVQYAMQKIDTELEELQIQLQNMQAAFRALYEKPKEGGGNAQ